MGFRFQKRLSILPGVRLNLSKGGVSTSLGPRGADVNIGKDGVTTNAGIPGTGLSYRSKLGSHGSKLGILAVVAGLGVWGLQHWSKVEKAVAPVLPVTASAAPAAASPVNTPTPGLRYVHRAGSVLREEAKASGKTLKKESKGAQVTLISEDGGWAKVSDGPLTGYMRASVLGADPPD